jgi:hypothetical protein
MANTLKTLGQSDPLAATLTTLYTVPGATSCSVSSISVCNRSATATSFRVAVRPAGAGITDEHYLYYDVAIPGNDTFIATVGVSLETTDVISVYATLATLSFSVWGQEHS